LNRSVKLSRRGFTVALIGADGAGKTTVARRLEDELARPARYIYMGVNWEASNHLLPTTRLMHALRRARGRGMDRGGPPPRPAGPPPARPLSKRLLRGGWSALSLANRLAEEWYRQLLAWTYVRRGFVVLFDRHFFSDYHAHDIAGVGHRTFDRYVHGFLLAYVYPKPNLVVFLDAPPELLFARKGEGTIEALDRRRHDYLALADSTPRFVSVDAGQPLDAVVRAVAREIESFGSPSATPEPAR
jgi:thymidylate kinase